MVRNVVKRGWLVALLGVAAAAFLLMSSGDGQHSARAASPGGTVAPLLSCPNVDGSVDNKVLISDIISVVQAYFKDYPATNYVFMYDLNNPYNPQTGLGGQQRVDDILAVVTKYFTICPLVDTQVAQATRWALDTDGNPGNGMQPVPQLENAAALHAMHYYEASSDVPGQGTHYVNLDNWDGVFNPKAPEGLIYNNGRIVAQLYVADANVVGLGTHTVGPCSPGCPGAEYGVELETAADGPQCNPVACSWDGPETWHLHHYLCTVHIGTGSAVAVPGSLAPSVGDTQAHCATFSGGEPLCTVPVTATPCYMWSHDSGWMGHLYNWYPNANRISDVNGTMNGRFSDCFPDVDGWKAHNCPG